MQTRKEHIYPSRTGWPSMQFSLHTVLIANVVGVVTTHISNARCAILTPPLTLSLRGGDSKFSKIIPGIAWSQEDASLLCKVDMPSGFHSADGLKITNTHMIWKEGNVDLDLHFFAEVNSDSASIFSDGGRQIKVRIPKKSNSWWPRLTSGPKPAFVKIDWATWKDDDEAETRKYVAGMKHRDDDFNYEMGKEDDVAAGADQFVDDDKDLKDEGGPDAGLDGASKSEGKGAAEMTDA